MNQLTVLELLKQTFPSNYVKAIVKNTLDKNMLGEESSGFILEDLVVIFIWENSIEGEEFWEEVYDAIKDNTELPDLPFRAKWQPNTYIHTRYGGFIVNTNDEEFDLEIDIDMSEKPKQWSEKFFVERHLAFLN